MVRTRRTTASTIKVTRPLSRRTPAKIVSQARSRIAKPTVKQPTRKAGIRRIPRTQVSSIPKPAPKRVTAFDPNVQNVVFGKQENREFPRFRGFGFGKKKFERARKLSENREVSFRRSQSGEFTIVAPRGTEPGFGGVITTDRGGNEVKFRPFQLDDAFGGFL